MYGKLLMLVCITFGSCANNEMNVSPSDTDDTVYIPIKRACFQKRKSIFDKKREYSDEEINWKRKYEIFQVFVDKNNQIFVGGKLVRLENLKLLGKTFYRNYIAVSDSPYADQAMISLRKDKAARYQLYLSVYNELRQVYAELWEEEAQKTYKLSFNKLNLSEKKLVRKKIPLFISEAEPAEF
jgi:biopolymer transport protein ExbD